MRNLIVAISLIVLALPTVANADFSDGMRAYREGAYSTAFQRWIVLAEAGDAKAQNNLGVLYRRGLGVEKNSTKAVEWYEKSANQKFAKAQFNLGLMYKTGSGVKKDITRAIEWYKKSARNGYARAQFALGLRFEKGNGVKRNPVVGLSWLNLAMEKASGNFRRNVAAARRRISSKLSDDQIQKAHRLTEEFDQDS
jgi:uncharacterized protein